MRPNEAGRARERRRGPAPKPYRVVLRGELSGRFAAEFEGMALTCGEGRTYLNGRIDQSQLHGILEKARHYNLEIIEVADVREAEQPDS